MTMFPIYVELGVYECEGRNGGNASWNDKRVSCVLLSAFSGTVSCSHFVVGVFSVAKVLSFGHNYTVVVYSHNADHRSSADHRQFVVSFDTAALWFV